MALEHNKMAKASSIYINASIIDKLIVQSTPAFHDSYAYISEAITKFY